MIILFNLLFIIRIKEKNNENFNGKQRSCRKTSENLKKEDIERGDTCEKAKTTNKINEKNCISEPTLKKEETDNFKNSEKMFFNDQTQQQIAQNTQINVINQQNFPTNYMVSQNPMNQIYHFQNIQNIARTQISYPNNICINYPQINRGVNNINGTFSNVANPVFQGTLLINNNNFRQINGFPNNIPFQNSIISQFSPQSNNNIQAFLLLPMNK